MDTLLNELFPAHRLPYSIMLARMMGAMLFGALIGIERERHDKAAGLRTHILISLAAAVFAILSTEAAHMPIFNANLAQIDPLRVVEAVTSGVAFLAAGMIVFSKGTVHGLTTGAGMWLSGAVGLALGFGFWVIGAIASLSCFLVLGVIGRLMGHGASNPKK
ncbi:MgtC/SapB family protein [Rhizobium paknamense]|nr:MgtC/SapB family protein [Rhizobium paknamense]